MAISSLQAAQEAGIPVIAYGKFINAIIQFLIVAFALFLVIRQMNVLKRRMERGDEKAPVAPPREQVLLEEIRDILKTQNR